MSTHVSDAQMAKGASLCMQVHALLKIELIRVEYKRIVLLQCTILKQEKKMIVFCLQPTSTEGQVFSVIYLFTMTLQIFAPGFLGTHLSYEVSNFKFKVIQPI